MSVLKVLRDAKNIGCSSSKKSKQSTDTEKTISSYPKSISISTMMKLGSEIPMKVKNPDVVDLIGFDVSKMEWRQLQRTHIFIEEKPFSKGGFRLVNKGKTFDKTYVIKRFLPEAILEIKNINKTVEKKETTVSLSKKAVQMHKLASSFTDEMKKLLLNIGKKEEYGKTFSKETIAL